MVTVSLEQKETELCRFARTTIWEEMTGGWPQDGMEREASRHLWPISLSSLEITTCHQVLCLVVGVRKLISMHHKPCIWRHIHPSQLHISSEHLYFFLSLYLDTPALFWFILYWTGYLSNGSGVQSYLCKLVPSKTGKRCGGAFECPENATLGVGSRM